MKTIKLALTLVITALFSACDATSSDSLTLDSGKAIESAVTLDEQNSAESVLSSNMEPQIQEDFNTTDWAPLITRTPAKQAHEPFFLPDENVKRLKKSFHRKTNSTKIQDDGFFENEHVFYGHIDYSSGISISYLFDKENNNYFNRSFLMRGNYKLNRQFNRIDKDIIYKILEISGADDPEIFFQELISSPKITKYKGCIVQQKQSKYAMVDLTSCEFDNRTDLSLYNPKSKP